MSEAYASKYFNNKRVTTCKFIFLALMWLQSDEDKQTSLQDDYMSPLSIENSEWYEERYPDSDVEHFRDVSNTVRMGIWTLILQRELSDELDDLPTCLHDASRYALFGIAMMLVDKELEGVCLHPQDKYFARSTVLESLQLLDTDTVLAKGEPLDFPLTLQEAKSLLPVDRKEELEIELEKFLIHSYEHDFKDDAPDISKLSGDYIGAALKDFFYSAEWWSDINREAVAQLQEKYGFDYAVGAVSPQTADDLRWGRTLRFFRHYFPLSTIFIESESDLFLLEQELSSVESSDEYIESELPTGYFRIKHYLESYTDRTLVLSRLVHTLVYFLLVRENYQSSHIDNLMEIPTSSHTKNSLQAALEAAVYRCGYYMAVNSIPESEVGSSWLFSMAFPNLRDFYQAGRSDGKDVV
jgi:hypothetical protein